MMKSKSIAVLADARNDLPPELLDKYHIYILPLMINIKTRAIAIGSTSHRSKSTKDSRKKFQRQAYLCRKRLPTLSPKSKRTASIK